MSVYELRREIIVPAPLDEVFAFFSRARNLERITPAFLRFHVITPDPIVMKPGAIIDYRLRVRGIPVSWRTVIETWDPPAQFSDRQERGPYRLWHHTHRFRAVESGTAMEDFVQYALPFGVIGSLVHWLQVRRDVEAIFDYREKCIREIFTGK